MWRLVEHGHFAAGAVAAAPPAIPLGLVAGGACWAYRRFRMRTGAGGLTHLTWAELLSHSDDSLGPGVHLLITIRS